MSMMPAKARDTSWKRWLNIVLRTIHAASVLLLAAALLGGTDATLPALLTLLSGAAMLLTDILNKPSFIFEFAGIGMVVKLVLVALMKLFPSWSLHCFWLIFVFSMLLSHAPGSVRHWQPFERK